ncbi:Major facilitator superfamily (MFS) profile domain-containing protein [[Candida] zeylanoides]
MSFEKGKDLGAVVSVADLDSTARGEVLEVITSPTGKPVNITGDCDEAMEYAIHNKEDHIEIDAATSRRLLRKIDLCLMPVMCLLYSFQFMDKLSTSSASIMGMREELEMVGDKYSWTGSAFYLGYLAFEFPASYMLQRFPVAKTVGVFIVVWGMILCLHAVPQYAGFIALRTILGMLESSVTPAFTIITSQWYTRDEQFLRVAMWFACNGLGSILGSAIGYGLVTHITSYPIHAWKLVFVITGCMTIGLGFVVIAHVPDSPLKAWFLTPQERRLVVERIRGNQQGFGNKHFKKSQFIEAFTDYKTWLFVLFGLANNIPNGATTNFGAILMVGSFGYTPTKSMLMGMISGGIEIVGCIGLAYLTRFVHSRMVIAICGTAVVVVADCMLGFCDNKKAQLGGFLLTSLAPIGFICMLSIVASNVAGHTKKVTTNAIFLVSYCVGNLVGPQTFIDSQAPDYVGGKISIAVCGVCSFVILIAIFASYIRENKKRDLLDMSQFEKFDNSEFADLTDKENPKFRYSL